MSKNLYWFIYCFININKYKSFIKSNLQTFKWNSNVSGEILTLSIKILKILKNSCFKKWIHAWTGSPGRWEVSRWVGRIAILKYIKNHLRNRLGDDHVDALNVMNGNKDLLMVIDNEVLIKEICKSSPEFSKNLII